MPTQEQIKDYLVRSGDTSLNTSNLMENEHGFMSYEIHGTDMVIMSMYGDGKFWFKQANDLAKDFGCKNIIFSTIRNPKSFEKRHNCKFLAYLMVKEVE